MCYHYMYTNWFLILVLDTEHVRVPTDCKTQCEHSCAGMPAVKVGACGVGVEGGSGLAGSVALKDNQW